MAKLTDISWADSTLNIWMGCQETGSPACVGCYARQLVEARFKRTVWGPHGKRVETKDWRAKLREISREALKAGRPWFVFVNSLSDFWDNQADPVLRAQALREFEKYPHLTFLLLTKRPQNIAKMWLAIIRQERADKGLEGEEPSDGQLLALYDWPKNIAIGCTVVTQPEADRDLPHLLRAAEWLKPAFAFVSLEPLAELIELTKINTMMFRGAEVLNALTGELSGMLGEPAGRTAALGWVIAGGGTDQGKFKAYPSHPDWFRAPRDDCAEAGVAYHFKQWGEWAPGENAGPIKGPQTGAFLEADGSWHEERFTRRAATELTTFDEPDAWRVGKKTAGRLLDGALHDARPEVAHV
jgi:protein gp37